MLEKLRAATDCFLWTVGRSMITRVVSQYSCPCRAGACSEARKMAQKILSTGNINFISHSDGFRSICWPA